MNKNVTYELLWELEVLRARIGSSAFVTQNTWTYNKQDMMNQISYMRKLIIDDELDLLPEQPDKDIPKMTLEEVKDICTKCKIIDDDGYEMCSEDCPLIGKNNANCCPLDFDPCNWILAEDYKDIDEKSK